MPTSQTKLTSESPGVTANHINTVYSGVASNVNQLARTMAQFYYLCICFQYAVISLIMI